MPRLVVETGSDTGKVYELDAQTVIGRLKTNEIPIDDPMISREHSKITKEPDGFYISDLGSRNGTLVNLEKIQTRKLNYGDKITVGRITFRFEESVIPASAEGQSGSAEIPPAKPATLTWILVGVIGFIFFVGLFLASYWLGQQLFVKMQEAQEKPAVTNTP